uniref:CSON004683 protein n=1 Tax=Culicoides sonorensis TaxID=179676 RepID=A0A336MTV8_CULSO
MKTLLFLILSLSLISIILANETEDDETFEPQLDFLALFRATSNNQTKDCTAVLLSPTNVIAASHCAYFDPHQEHNLTYHICFNPEKCITEINEVDCRSFNYTYKPRQEIGKDENNGTHGFQRISIENILLMQFNESDKFMSEPKSYPIIDPYAEIEFLQNLQGFVIACDGSEYVYDIYAVDRQPAEGDMLKFDKDIFYATCANQSIANLDILPKLGGVFVVLGEEKEVYLMGISSPENESPQPFIFVPSSFEEMNHPGEEDQPSVEL